MIDRAPEMCTFGDEVMQLARDHGIKTQAALVRALHSYGYLVPERTLANYLYGRTTTDPAFPVSLADALCLNKTERRRLANAFTYGQPPRRQLNKEAS